MMQLLKAPGISVCVCDSQDPRITPQAMYAEPVLSPGARSLCHLLLVTELLASQVSWPPEFLSAACTPELFADEGAAEVIFPTNVPESPQ